MMKFEDQYPGIEQLIGHNSRVRRARRELLNNQAELEKRSKQNFKEAVMMAISVPIIMVILFFAYVFVWTMVG